MTGDGRKLHDNELHNLCSSTSIVRMVKSKRLRWADKTELDLREIKWGGIDWIHLARDRDRWRALVNTVMNFWVP
jgi:hypothetical protein